MKIATFIVLLITGLLAAGIAVAYATGASAVVLYTLTGHKDFLAALPQRMLSSVDIFALMSMPLFIFAGEVMNRSGITAALVDFSSALIGKLKGGLGHVNILTSVFFAGISGSAIADAAALGTTLVPAMRRQGYSGLYAGAITAASSIIGPIIPPSIILIFYGAIMGEDIAILFAAGLVPGLLLALLLMGANSFYAHRDNHPGGRDFKTPPLIPSFLRAVPALFLPVIILSGIVFGWMTPTEAASVAALTTLVVGALYRTLHKEMVKECLTRTITLSGAIFAIMVATSLISLLAAVSQTPQFLSDIIQQSHLSNTGLMLALLGVFFVIGMFSETQIGLALVAPILVPVAVAHGLDPHHLGIIICLDLAMGLITPPLGGSILVTSTVTGLDYWKLVKATAPFAFLQYGFLLVLALFPDITLFLPRALGMI